MITFELLISEDNCSTEQKLYGRKSYFDALLTMSNAKQKECYSCITCKSIQCHGPCIHMFWIMGLGMIIDMVKSRPNQYFVFEINELQIPGIGQLIFSTILHSCSALEKKSKEKFAKLIKVSQKRCIKNRSISFRIRISLISNCSEFI